MGVKVDAVPGRLNEIAVIIASPGRYSGQCSELCGAGHAFMPIRIEAVSPDQYAMHLLRARPITRTILKADASLRPLVLAKKLNIEH